MASVFLELTVIVVMAVLISALMSILRQPLIIGYILTGIIAGPVLGIIQSTQAIETFANIGIALLLFIVGLNLNPKTVREVGPVALITGVGQVIFTSLIGFLIASIWFNAITSLYVAVALTFSSTIIIMKLLSDKGDLDTLYGRISIGFLIVQDFIAIFALMLISSATDMSFIFSVLLRGIGLLAGLFVAAAYIFPYMTKHIAKSQEFLLLFSLGWCFATASVFYVFDFSIEAGALLAGITLAVSPYKHEISSKLRPLRDFFIVMFFILLGSQMSFGVVDPIPAVILSLFILIGNPLIVILLMTALGYTKRNGFLSGLTVAQISEFSLILIALGVAQGHIHSDILSLVTVIGLFTIAGSTYFIQYSSVIFPLVAGYLPEKKGKKVDEHAYHNDNYDIILFGYNRIGYDILHAFNKLDNNFMIVDYNPDVVKELAAEGYHCRYGDAQDIEMLEELNLDHPKMILSTIPDLETNMLLIHTIRKVNEDAVIAVVSHQIDDALALYDAGATYVLLPHFLGGRHMSTIIEKFGLDAGEYHKERKSHMAYLAKRKKMGHEHPKH